VIRSVETLRRDQAEVLTSYREESAPRVPVAERSGAALPTAAVVYGRVSLVVESDPTYGPHLEVIQQVWDGVPPSPADGSAPAVRCYPTPNRTVNDYLVNDYVRIAPARGVLLAEALA